VPRLAILSDTHFERRTPPGIDRAALPDFDILIHAGDLSERDLPRALDWLAGIADGRPTIWCPGNHDLYGVGTRWQDAPLTDRVAEVAFAAAARDIATLAPGPIVIGYPLSVPNWFNLMSPVGGIDMPGVVVVGATLWSDWRLAALWTFDDGYAEVDLENAALERLPGIRPMDSPDFVNLLDRFGREWRPWAIAAEHAIHVNAIDHALTDLAPRADGARDQALIVVTHHAPHPSSVEPYRHQAVPLWAPGFYASDLTWLIQRHAPDIWIHGHVHVPVDYRIGRTRIVSNPRPSSFELKVLEV
jgi:3',5'-cyclic AMP phosphodiesterase CpdA